ncbi:pentapeptide repeat-containing protein [Streptomyces sp. NPDC058426]|uniref:pentapeptide repeat-containing protein n=1 Tax=Streptomyces sp. NPDC058426 TaxID=3346493 RepID=UPI00364AB3FE
MPPSSRPPRLRRNNRSTTRTSLAARRAVSRRGSQEPGRLDWARRVELGTVVVAAVVAAGGLWYTNVQAQQTNEQLQQANEQALKADAQAKADLSLATEGQVTERYTAAVENLGHDKTDVRLGGIYGLQRITKDSLRDQPTIGNILAAYVRTNASKAPAKGHEIPADVHAAFMVLGTRDRKHDGDFRLDLREARLPRLQAARFPEDSGVDLSGGMLLGIDLSGAFLPSAKLSHTWLSGANLFRTSLPESDLSHAMLYGANLAYANLTDANLKYSSLSSTHLNEAWLSHSVLSHASLSLADLSKANLHEADLTKADVSGANLFEADLAGAKLTNANFFRTNLSGAELTGADLSGTDLSTVKNLTQKQVSSARTNRTTRLPSGLTRASSAPPRETRGTLARADRQD